MEIRTPQGPYQVADGKWVAKVIVKGFLKAHPEDNRIPLTERPLTVPVRHWAQVLGLRESQARSFFTERRMTTPKDYLYCSNEEMWWVVADKPFVMVLFRDHDEWAGDHAKNQRGITVARQVHRGQLGRYVEIDRTPTVVPSNIPNPKDTTQSVNWVRLAKLSEITGLPPEDILYEFAGFSPSTIYEPNVPLLVAPNAAAIRSMGCPNVPTPRFRFYSVSLPQSFCGGEEGWGGTPVGPDGKYEGGTFGEDILSMWEAKEGLWVPQRFATDVLRLTQFGYRRNNETPEPSFKLEAQMPTAPEVEFPVLPVEKLRELHELRGKLRGEVSASDFQQAAEKACESIIWTRARNLDDKSQGFSYYTDFEKVQAFSGQLVIGKCYWTRAGHDKTSNYYAGFLAVFPQMAAVEDPRTDPRAILRIWFWPGELLRQTPSGSKDGLCPPEVIPEIADRVKYFLTQLGYTI
ncbi:MAG: hypothetical protein KW802_01860 [Candidatus Doudnabacteria bacterium]|nr:hypothetical protein [Candidatus Doudnabacteria bacterium]